MFEGVLLSTQRRWFPNENHSFPTVPRRSHSFIFQPFCVVIVSRWAYVECNTDQSDNECLITTTFPYHACRVAFVTTQFHIAYTGVHLAVAISTHS